MVHLITVRTFPGLIQSLTSGLQCPFSYTVIIKNPVTFITCIHAACCIHLNGANHTHILISILNLSYRLFIIRNIMNLLRFSSHNETETETDPQMAFSRRTIAFGILSRGYLIHSQANRPRIMILHTMCT